MRISNPVSATTKANGSTPKKPRAATKPAITFSRVCPASILANNRTDRLIGRERYEITSIGISKGYMGSGVPGGTKKLKKCIPCFAKPNTVTPMKMTNANAKVTTMWLVKVKL